MAKQSVSENPGWFRQRPNYRGVGLGMFHCIVCFFYYV